VDQHGVSIVLADVTQPSIVTVAFSHCETVCPTTVRHIMSARIAAGRDSMPLFIVTVDPWRDTVERLPTIARSWALAATDHVLSGDVSAVERTLDVLSVGRSRDPNSGDVAHAVVVLLLDGRGRVTQRLDGDASGLTALLAAAR
jgi:cytochrome oxidase Cu insertion factor (SCO1/SenC/PrrC family)